MLPAFQKPAGKTQKDLRRLPFQIQAGQPFICLFIEGTRCQEACRFINVPAFGLRPLHLLQQKIQQAYQDNSEAFQKAQQEKMQPITTKLLDAIKAVGKAGGYVYIMDLSAGIPYVSDTLSKDVTAEVKAELNKMK